MKMNHTFGWCTALVAGISIATASNAAAAAAFSNQTAAAGLTYSTNPAEDAPGIPMWGGASVGDFNGDGWPDVFVAGGGDVADRLFINNQNGTFTDQHVAWGLTTLYRGNGSTVGDYDNDGDVDLFVNSAGDMSSALNSSEHKLYQNQHAQGSNTFVNVSVAAGVNLTSTTSGHFAFGCAFGDYDLDGRLDLFVNEWVPADGTTDGNRLFHNNGNGTFTDVTVAAGVHDLTYNGFGARFADMNGDRYPELLVTADFESSHYFVNNKNGTFTNMTTSANLGKDRNGMGNTVADFNNDGLFDWYVTSIFTASPRTNNGNILYINNGSNVFTQLGESAGVSDGGWGWGTAAFDVDHDGWVDIVETNGWFDAEWLNEPSYIFKNNGNLTFTEVHASAGLVNTYQGRALLQLDYDRDGDLDVIISSNNFQNPTNGGPLELYRNDISGPSTNWLELNFNTDGIAGLAPNGFGTIIRIKAGGTYRYAQVSGGSNFIGQGQLLAHFGLGSSTTVDELYVEWANGSTSLLTGVAANQIMTLTPPASFTPGITIGDVFLLEGNSGTTNAVFTLNLTASSPSNVMVNYATADGTAAAGTDYTFTSGTKTILAGATTATIEVPITGDTAGELAENFHVQLTSPVNANIGDSDGLGTINNDDAVMLVDDFDNGVQSWTIQGSGATWSESDGNLVGVTATKARVNAPLPWTPSGVTGCTLCTIEVTMSSAGGLKNVVSLVGWARDNKNFIEVRMEEALNRWAFSQKTPTGTTTARANAVIDPNVDYRVRTSWDGSNFRLWVNDALLITTPMSAGSTTPAGNVGLRVERTTGTFRSIVVSP